MREGYEKRIENKVKRRSASQVSSKCGDNNMRVKWTEDIRLIFSRQDISQHKNVGSTPLSGVIHILLFLRVGFPKQMTHLWQSESPRAVSFTRNYRYRGSTRQAIAGFRWWSDLQSKSGACTHLTWWFLTGCRPLGTLPWQRWQGDNRKQKN